MKTEDWSLRNQINKVRLKGASFIMDNFDQYADISRSYITLTTILTINRTKKVPKALRKVFKTFDFGKRLTVYHPYF